MQFWTPHMPTPGPACIKSWVRHFRDSKLASARSTAEVLSLGIKRIMMITGLEVGKWFERPVVNLLKWWVSSMKA